MPRTWVHFSFRAGTDGGVGPLESLVRRSLVLSIIAFVLATTGFCPYLTKREAISEVTIYVVQDEDD
jgi:hypothetical protein